MRVNDVCVNWRKKKNIYEEKLGERTNKNSDYLKFKKTLTHVVKYVRAKKNQTTYKDIK